MFLEKWPHSNQAFSCNISNSGNGFFTWVTLWACTRTRFFFMTAPNTTHYVSEALRKQWFQNVLCRIIVYSPNKMHKSQSLFNLTTALHVSGVTITHLQEHKTTGATASGNRYTVLLSAAIVEELEPVWVCCGWRTPCFMFRASLSPIFRSTKQM